MRAKSCAALALLALVLGCGKRDAGLDVAPNIVDRARLGGELLFVDSSRSEVDALDVTTNNPAPSVVRIGVRANPKAAIERKGWASYPATSAQADPLKLGEAEGSGAAADEVLVLSDGSCDASDEYVDPPTLTSIKQSHKVQHYELSAPYTRMRLSEDGRYAILWGQTAGACSRQLLSNPNRVALIDLDRSPAQDNPYERTLKATGGDLSDVLLTPALVIGATSRPVALFSFGSGLGVWDITNPDHEDITVEGLSASSAFVLNRVVADQANAKLYLVQQKEKDLRVLSFGPSEDPNASNDFRLSLNQLPLSLVGASDMIPYLEGDATNVLVAVGTILGIVHTNDSRVGKVTLPNGGTAERLHSFKGLSPKDNDEKQRVLAWGPGRTTLYFVELNNLENAGSKNIESLSLGYSLSDLVPLPGGNLMLAVLSGGGVGTLDLDARRFKPLAATIQLSSPLLESDAHRVWVGGNSDSRIGYFEPETLATGSLRLDDAVQEMFLFEKGDQRRIVVAHNSPMGSVTIVDAEKATRALSRVLTGFLVDGLVDR